jgi:hypothetical protein
VKLRASIGSLSGILDRPVTPGDDAFLAGRHIFKPSSPVLLDRATQYSRASLKMPRKTWGYVQKMRFHR